jgi:hypothetical protein
LAQSAKRRDIKKAENGWIERFYHRIGSENERRFDGNTAITT